MFPGLLGSPVDHSSGNVNLANGTTAANKAMLSNQQSSTSRRNPFLNELFAELCPLYNQSRNCTTANSEGTSPSQFQMDGFLLYIFAVIVRDLIRQGGSPPGFPSFLETVKDNIRGGFPTAAAERATRQQSKANDSPCLIAYQLFIESLRVYPWNWCVIIITLLYLHVVCIKTL
jgi:hypothetical protein